MRTSFLKFLVAFAITCAGIAQVNAERVKSKERFVKVTQTKYKGMSVEKAKNLAQKNNTLFRVVIQDGRPLRIKKDYRPGRINAEVKNGIVVRYNIEGQ